VGRGAHRARVPHPPPTVELQIFLCEDFFQSEVLQIKFWEYMLSMFDTVYEPGHALHRYCKMYCICKPSTYIITGEASSVLLA
jgi:hypothetical protein